MASIRVNTGVKRIEVNDNGDYITLSLNDNAFIDRFFALRENSQKIADEYTERQREIEKKYQGSQQEEAYTREVLALYSEAGQSMMSEVDGLFGEGTCKKVFGDIAPSLELYYDFFEQLTPYLKEFAKEKAERMSKYSANRTGNV